MIGKVTSGTISPVLGVGIGLGYVTVENSKPGSEIFIDVRGKALKAGVFKAADDLKDEVFLLSFSPEQARVRTIERSQNNQGIKLLEKEKIKEAYAIFDNLARENPVQTLYRYNRAIAATHLLNIGCALRLQDLDERSCRMSRNTFFRRVSCSKAR
ncbi:MAG: glycine cleavage T C-terminal barrel domain-containing protein [Bacteroidota bacterium]